MSQTHDTFLETGCVARKWVLGVPHRKEYKDTLNKSNKQQMYLKRTVHSQEGESG